MAATEKYDTVILGAGAAGMMCAAQAGRRGGRVLVVDHARAAGEKIRISGGGRCNFTNLHTGAANFLSQNPHFVKSALSRYSPQDFIGMVDRHAIKWHEKAQGQLFCDDSAGEIIAMLRVEMARAGAQVALQTTLGEVRKTTGGFALTLAAGGKETAVACRNFVVASGGRSIPKMGASAIGYRLARQFGLPLTETRAALVPLTFGAATMAGLKPLAGVALNARISGGGARFREALLITHRGLSGPAILQISSYWRAGEAIEIDLLPAQNAFEALKIRQRQSGRRAVATVLGDLLPKRLAAYLAAQVRMDGAIAGQPDTRLRALADALHHWQLRPTGTEGYRVAEVTLGGVDTGALAARTLAARAVPGLYFIGEVVDVTGWLGGYNFQWAWSSGWAAGTAIATAPHAS